ncbi:MAG: helix-turn-helix domain-containing protein, partial [Catenulispora sp.]
MYSARVRWVTVDASRLPIGPPSAERADAARNREHLLKVAREMISESGVRRVTMDALAERAKLGKGTVFR